MYFFVSSTATLELQTFFTNINKALQKCTLEQLNDAIVAHLKSRVDNREEIDSVLKLVADEYSITVHTLITSNSRGKVQTARHMAISLLHYDLSCTTRFIASHVFFKWLNSISRAIKYHINCNPDVKDDRDFLETYKKLQKQVKQITNGSKGI